VHLVAQTEGNRANVIARVKRYFRNSKNFEHIKRLDIDHFAKAIFGRIVRSPVVRAEYETFLRNQKKKFSEIDPPPPNFKRPNGKAFRYTSAPSSNSFAGK
jgi:hypothetical protein